MGIGFGLDRCMGCSVLYLSWCTVHIGVVDVGVFCVPAPDLVLCSQ